MFQRSPWLPPPGLHGGCHKCRQQNTWPGDVFFFRFGWCLGGEVWWVSPFIKFWCVSRPVKTLGSFQLWIAFWPYGGSEVWRVIFSVFFCQPLELSGKISWSFFLVMKAACFLTFIVHCEQVIPLSVSISWMVARQVSLAVRAKSAESQIHCEAVSRQDPKVYL